MLRKLKTFLSIALLTIVAERAYGFAMLGLPEAWMLNELNYNSPVKGPMNLGDEYRWNSSIITYGFDQAFLNYFGADGVRAVKEAVTILTNLPAASEMSADLSEFQIDTRRRNYEADALGLFDLKSEALATMLNQLGVGCAERWTWCIRARIRPNQIDFFSVTKRNFDPVTWRPSSYVNGQLYTYFVQQITANPDSWDAIDLAVDPAQPILSTVAALTDVAGPFGANVDTRGLFQVVTSGLFYTGLTRDDVGALRYLLRPENVNMEVLPPGVSGGGGFGGGGAGGVWSPADGTLVSVPAPWGLPGGGFVFIGNTNNPVTTNTFTGVDLGLRPGVDKISFVEVGYDSILGTTVDPIRIRYQDHYITNGAIRSQSIERRPQFPDIIFTAGDLGVIGEQPIFTLTTYGWLNSTLNSAPVDPTQPAPAGPGVVVAPFGIAFSKLGPWNDHVGPGFEFDGFPGPVWGSYDGTTNAPIVYPDAKSIQEIEARALNGGLP
jgi:hypothetical protein